MCNYNKVIKEISDLNLNLKIWCNEPMSKHTSFKIGGNIVTIPVTPGRNLAIIVEVAAMNNRQKKMGYNAAKELLDTLGMDYSGDDTITSNQISLNI